MACESKVVLYVVQYNGTIVKIVTGAAVPFSSWMANQSTSRLAFDSYGILYVSELNSGVITKITADGTKTIVQSSLPYPSGLVFDRAGNYFLSVFGASSSEGIIYKYAATGRTTFA